MTVYTKGDTSHRSYRDPAGGTESDIGPQIRTDFYAKKALIDLKKEQYFSQLADTTSMPKHFGKTIKKYHYLALLDDRNINDQGIDANGVVGTATDTADLGYWSVESADAGGNEIARVDAESATVPFADAAAVAAYIADEFPDGYSVGGVMHNDLTVNATYVAQAIQAGNLYGSSKDIGTIVSKMPALSEHGGRVNRVGFKRVELEGSLEKFGYFDEYTQESMDFDTDAELMMHVNREMLRGANEITEDALQIDLLNGAGVVRYAADATTKAEIAAGEVITYAQLEQLAIDLDNNRCPKNTKIITGSRMIDTRTIDGARYLYIGSDLLLMVKAMMDSNGNPAWVPTHQYGAATTLATGERGSVGEFRVIVVPEMMHEQDGGAGGIAVYPMLVVGDGSFTTIGFQTDGKTVKFKIIHKKPGKDIADRDDPYGEIGFMSIKWYYGFMLQRPEHLAVCWSAKPA